MSQCKRYRFLRLLEGATNRVLSKLAPYKEQLNEAVADGDPEASNIAILIMTISANMLGGPSFDTLEPLIDAWIAKRTTQNVC
jgi:hypothetical protein